MLQNKLNGIDIIIPVYNGYEDLRKCMDSVLKYTDMKENGIVLIDDKSPDDRIIPLLKKYESQYNNISVIANSENRGFSANVNRGMQVSGRDVILLNSDTIVTKGWVEKIKACAYQKKEIATVTPLSNAATLCSIPFMCTDNPLPAGIDVDEMGEIVERHSLKKYPRITVAVGFCMFIKREVINKVGEFDEKTFGKGYGEENDFCNRAEQYGYIHVMCDDTFVFHKGTVSFATEEKKALCDEHNKILENRYPKQMKKNALYCMENPDQYIRDNINLYIRLKNGKKNILYFIHSDFREDAADNKGGTQFHVRDMVENFKNIYNVFVLARDGENMFLTIYKKNEVEQLRFPIDKKDLFQKVFDAKLEFIIDNIINAFKIDIVHVHHTFSLSLDVFYVAKKHNIPLLVTMHDYYYVCPTIKLVNKDGKFCNEDLCSREYCSQCLAEKCGYSRKVQIIDEWRNENEKALLMCDVIVVPSESAGKTIVNFLPSLSDKIKVIEHGEDVSVPIKTVTSKSLIEGAPIQGSIDYCMNHPLQVNAISGWAYMEGVNSSDIEIYLQFKTFKGQEFIEKAEKNKRDDLAVHGKQYLLSGFIFHTAGMNFENGKVEVRVLLKYKGKLFKSTIKSKFDYHSNKIEGKRLNVAFLGAGIKEKGSEIITKLVKDNELEDIAFYLIGPIGDKSLNTLQSENFVSVGTYDKEKLSQIINYYEIDIICILPVWGETFCYTLSEAILCGIPVIGTNIGAVGERIQKTNCGWTVTTENTHKEVKKIFQQILKNRLILNEKKKIVENVKLKSVETMASEYQIIYESFKNNECNYMEFSSRFIFKAYKSVARHIETREHQLIDVENNDLKAKIKRKIKGTHIFKYFKKFKTNVKI